MTALRLALTELRRLTSGRLPRLALVAMMFVPTMYAGLYLYANKDPYAGLSRVPAAIVVEDAGTTLANGERLSAGPTVAHDLVASRSFDWREVDRAEATAGVADGRYDFALIVPSGFSGDLASSTELTPRQAHLQVATNDANNYIAHTIANQVVAQVTKSVAGQVSSTAANQLLLGFSTIHSKVNEGVDGADRLQAGIVKTGSGAGDLAIGAGKIAAGEKTLVAGTTKLRDGAATAAAGATTLASGNASMAVGLRSLDARTADLPAQTQALAVGAQQVSAGNAAVARAGAGVATASGQFIASVTTAQGGLAAALGQRGFTPSQIAAILAEVARLSGPATAANSQVQGSSTQVAALAAGATRVADGARQLAVSAGPLHDGIHQAAGGATHLRDGAGGLASGVDRLSSGAVSLATGQQAALDGATKLDAGTGRLRAGLAGLSTGATTLHTALLSGVRSIPNPGEASRKAAAQTIGNPIAVTSTSQATAGSYGAGLAPFFLSLALWIGAYVLFLLVKPLSSRALAAGQPSLRVALGGWFPPALFGLAQGGLAFAVVFFGLGIHVEHPGAVLALMFCTSIAFVAILHALVARLGAVGKFLGLVLMVVQLVSAGGTFPWQTLPMPLSDLHHVLPMGYAVDGIRRLMYGGSIAPVGGDLVVLMAYLLLALVVSTFAARRARVWTPARVKPELVL
jgi:putative membrane protein